MSSNIILKILLDSDVIRHFLKGGLISILPQIYPGKLAILDIVKEELCRSQSLVTPVNNFIGFYKVEIIKISSNNQAYLEYARLLKAKYGEGESACMALAKFSKDIIASSNLKDIHEYCTINNIQYVTTMDIIHEAYKSGILDEAGCDLFIYDVTSKGSKLPCSSIKDYIKKYKT